MLLSLLETRSGVMTRENRLPWPSGDTVREMVSAVYPASSSYFSDVSPNSCGPVSGSDFIMSWAA